MSDPRETISAANPACTECGHPLLRHLFGRGFCTVTVRGELACRCTAFSGERPAKAKPLDTAIVAGADGLAVLAYIERPA